MSSWMTELFTQICRSNDKWSICDGCGVLEPKGRLRITDTEVRLCPFCMRNAPMPEKAPTHTLYINPGAMNKHGAREMLAQVFEELLCERAKTRRLEAEKQATLTALRDMLVIAEFDRWHCASTGRQLVYREAAEILKPTSDRQPEGETK